MLWNCTVVKWKSFVQLQDSQTRCHLIWITGVSHKQHIRLVSEFISILSKWLTFIRQYLLLSHKSFLGSGNILWFISRLCLLMVYDDGIFCLCIRKNSSIIRSEIFINTKPRRKSQRRSISTLCKLWKFIQKSHSHDFPYKDSIFIIKYVSNEKTTLRMLLSFSFHIQ